MLRSKVGPPNAVGKKTAFQSRPMLAHHEATNDLYKKSKLEQVLDKWQPCHCQIQRYLKIKMDWKKAHGEK